MKILIDIGHPAHVHYFRNFIKIMTDKNHEFFVTARDRSVIFKLLNYYNIDFISRGSGSKTFVGKIVYAFYSLFIIFRSALKFKPDIFISQGGVYTSPIAKLLNKASISTEDTENAAISHKISKLFGSYILSPTCFEKKISKKHLKYNSYQELFYLHPKYYAPNSEIYNYLNLDKGEKFVIIRFVDWNAHHDIGHNGISLGNKLKVVKKLSEYAKVFILSECELPNELIQFKINIPPERMHDALYYAELLYGESSTMASESACVGTPAIFIDNEGRGYTTEEEHKYGLVFNFKETLDDQEKSIQKAVSLLENINLKEEWHISNKKMISDKINPTEFLVWFIENYPKSIKIMTENLDFQLKFSKT